MALVTEFHDPPSKPRIKGGAWHMEAGGSRLLGFGTVSFQGEGPSNGSQGFAWA